MKKIMIIVVALFFVDSFSAQTETRALTDFSTLKVMGSLEVRLVQGIKNEVVISIPGSREEDLANIITEIKGGILSIYQKGKVKWKGNLVIVLTFKELNQINLSGASEITTIGAVKADEFFLTGTGAIDADLNFEVNVLTVDFSGASDLKLKGLAEKFIVNSTGASDLKAAEFIAKRIVIDVSGASNIKVHAVESITGEVTGSSSVSVIGSPTIRSINSKGVSSVHIGKQLVSVSENEDVELKLGNKALVVKEGRDSVRIKWRHTELVVLGDSVELKRTPKKRRSHWAGLDLGINGFLNSKNSINLSNANSTSSENITQFMELDYAKSLTFSFNFAEWFIPIKGHHFGFVTGFGTEWNNYELKHNVKLNPDGGGFVHSSVDEFNENYTWGEVDTVLNYSKNRFKTWFINAPLLLVLNTGNHKNKSFHLSVGAILGFNLQTKMKYKYWLNGEEKKDKDKERFNTNPFRVSATVRGGVGRFNLFATYSLTPLFENGSGPELYPFTVGLTLLGF